MCTAISFSDISRKQAQNCLYYYAYFQNHNKRLTMRPSYPLLALMLASAFPSMALANDFSGVWTGWQCPPGQSPQSGKCANLVLELHQKQERVCGSHIFATAGATQIDEGNAPSIIGTVGSDGAASAVVESNGMRQPVQANVELSLVKGKLQWKRLDQPGGNSLLPQSMQLTRSRHGTLFTPTFEQQLKAVCATVNVAPATQASPAPVPAPQQTPSR